MRFGLSPIVLSILLFLLGLFAGRFLNRCILRIPQKARFWESLRFLFAKEKTPGFQLKPKFLDWLPVIGTMRIPGRSPYSGRRILRREPWIELLNASLFVALYWLELPLSGEMAESSFSCSYSNAVLPRNLADSFQFFHLRYLYHLVLIEAMVVATFIDLDWMIIPDEVNLPAMAVGFVGSLVLGIAWAVPVWFQDTQLVSSMTTLLPDFLHPLIMKENIPSWIDLHSYWHGFLVSIVGALVGFLFIWIIRRIGHAALGIEAMGMGDVILMAMVGSFLGWQAMMIAFFLSLLFSVPVAVTRIALNMFSKKEISMEMPYGPYLCLGTLVTLMFWKWVWIYFENFFVLGGLLPLIGGTMAILLFSSLLLIQFTKKILGIPLYETAQTGEWSSADQLVYQSMEKVDPSQGSWKREPWQGEQTGRGAHFNTQWQNRN